MKVKIIFAWYDLWVGFFIDKKKKCLYFFPIPMVGIIFMKKGNYCEICNEPKTDEEMADYYWCNKHDKQYR